MYNGEGITCVTPHTLHAHVAMLRDSTNSWLPETGADGRVRLASPANKTKT
jgi:hypothetical protein